MISFRWRVNKEMTVVNKISSSISFLLGFSFIVCYADTVAWWRFDDKTPGESTSASEELVNFSSNGHGGKAISISGTQEGTDAALLPKFCSVKHGLNAVEIYDPVSGIKRANAAALSFQTEQTSSSLLGAAVRVADDEALRLSDFTIEAFVCTTGGTFNTIAPIVGKIKNGAWTSESWQIGLLSNGKLFMRYDGTNSDVHGDGSAVISDGAWHHVALTCAYDAEKDLSTYTMYVDYRIDFVKTKTGRTAYQTSGNNDIYIGGYGYVNGTQGRKFNGMIDEVRLSNVALGAADFLRRSWVDELVNENTVVFLPFDGMSGYSLDMVGKSVSAIPVSSGVNYEFSDDVPFAGLRDDMSKSQQSTNVYSMMFSTNGVAGSAVKLGKYAWANSDFTTELYFKAGANVTSAGEAQMLFKLANAGSDPIIQAMINNEANHLGCVRLVYYNYFTGTKVFSGQYIGANIDDGQWHHLALVYNRDRRELKCYLDYRLVKTVSSILLNTDETIGTIGSRVECDKQFFHGKIDSFRFTKRALNIGEFIAPEGSAWHEEASTIMRASFDGDYAVSASNPSWFIEGKGIRRDEKLESCHMPQFAESVKWSEIALDGKGGENTVTNKSSIYLNGSSVVFEDVPDIGTFDQTVELLCKIESLPAFAGIVRLNNDKAQIVGVNPVWALYRTDNGETVQMRCTMKDGEENKGVYLNTQIPISALSGSWHHFAMTISYDSERGETDFSFYVDGDFRSTVAAKGVLFADPALGYNVMVGSAIKLAASLVEPDTVGYFDELRISRGILPPEKFFYRFARKGSMVIVR